MKEKEIKEISSILLVGEKHEDINKISKKLTKGLSNEKNTIEKKEEIIFLLIVSYIKQSYVENEHILFLVKEYLELIDIYIQKKSNKPKDTKTKIDNIKNIKIILNHISYIRKLYSENYISSINDKLAIKTNDIRRIIYKKEGLYSKYFYQTLYKYILGYGIGYFNLMYSTIITLFTFAFLYYFYDAFVVAGNFTADFPGLEGLDVANFEYYIYLSILILSNLGANEALATTPYLRFLFSVEQVVGILFFGLFIFIVGKRI